MNRLILTIAVWVCFTWAVAPLAPPGPRDSWTTKTGYVWDGRKWFKPWHGKPSHPARPLGTKGLWNDGIPYDSTVSRKIQQWEREAAEGIR